MWCTSFCGLSFVWNSAADCYSIEQKKGIPTRQNPKRTLFWPLSGKWGPIGMFDVYPGSFPGAYGKQTLQVQCEYSLWIYCVAFVIATCQDVNCNSNICDRHAVYFYRSLTPSLYKLHSLGDLKTDWFTGLFCRKYFVLWSRSIMMHCWHFLHNSCNVSILHFPWRL